MTEKEKDIMYSLFGEAYSFKDLLEKAKISKKIKIEYCKVIDKLFELRNESIGGSKNV